MTARRSGNIGLLAAIISVLFICYSAYISLSPSKEPEKVLIQSNESRRPTISKASPTRTVSEPPKRTRPGRHPASIPPPTDDELLDASIAKLKKGNLAYSTPQKMKMGKTDHVVARIGGPNVSIQTLKSDLGSNGQGQVESAATPISTKMKMTLRSADFDITVLSSEEQGVGGEAPTQWEWDIVPKHSGASRLHLAAVVELKDISRDFTSIDRDISVEVDPVDAVEAFLKTNWQWIIATLTAVGGAGWKLLQDRKKTGQTPPSAAGAATA